MRFVLNSGVMTELNPIMDGINSLADAIIAKEIEWIAKPIGAIFAEGFRYLAEILNANSAEIVTLAITICAGGIMVAPLIGASTSKWFGKLFTVFWFGVIWRVLLV